MKLLTRDPTHKILIVGSDGLWEKLAEAATVNFIRKSYKDKESSEKICKELVTSTTNRWNKVDSCNYRNACSIEMISHASLLI